MTDQLKDSHLRLAERLLAEAHSILDDLHKPYLVYNFGGRDNSYEEHTLDAPPMDVRLTAVRTAGIAFDKAARIIDAMPSGGLQRSLSMLENLEKAFDLSPDNERDAEGWAAADAALAEAFSG